MFVTTIIIFKSIVLIFNIRLRKNILIAFK